MQLRGRPVVDQPFSIPLRIQGSLVEDTKVSVLNDIEWYPVIQYSAAMTEKEGSHVGNNTKKVICPSDVRCFTQSTSDFRCVCAPLNASP